MDNTSTKLELYAKLSQILVGFVALFYVLHIGQDIIVPVLFAVIIAILLNPLVNFLHSKKLGRLLSISIVLLLTVVVIGGLVYLIISQVSEFTATLPEFGKKVDSIMAEIMRWVSNTLHVSQGKIESWITKTRKGIDSMGLIGEAVSTLSGLTVIFILPIYVFIILYYKPLLLEFISRLFKEKNQVIVTDVLAQTKSLIQKYLVGLSIEVVIVAVMNSAGLMIIGLPYAIVWGILGALLNVIPYIGIIIASAFTMFLALVTISPGAMWWVFILYGVVQFIDNQYIVPRIVASKVRINALISILAVLTGGALWGFSGMFLAIPLTAILKVVLDRVEGLKPFGFLLGEPNGE